MGDPGNVVTLLLISILKLLTEGGGVMEERFVRTWAIRYDIRDGDVGEKVRPSFTGRWPQSIDA